MNQDNKGFTLIELMLAMGFVSALLLAIAMTVLQIGNIYNRGLTLKDVDQSGRSLASELQRSIAENSSFSLASKYISQGGVNPYGGRLCIGQYSYIWNYGAAIAINNPQRLNAYANSNNQIRFVKVLDPNASYCTDPTLDVDSNTAIEILNVSEHNLVVHNFAITTTATSSDPKTGQQLYSINVLIGTNDQTSLKGSQANTKCLIPNEVIPNKSPDPSYCFVNQFDIVARSGNVVQ